MRQYTLGIHSLVLYNWKTCIYLRDELIYHAIRPTVLLVAHRHCCSMSSDCAALCPSFVTATGIACHKFLCTVAEARVTILSFSPCSSRLLIVTHSHYRASAAMAAPASDIVTLTPAEDSVASFKTLFEVGDATRRNAVHKIASPLTSSCLLTSTDITSHTFRLSLRSQNTIRQKNTRGIMRKSTQWTPGMSALLSPQTCPASRSLLNIHKT